jgi:hypothetical protein
LGLAVQGILGALFAFPLETEFKRAILVVFPSFQSTYLARSGSPLVGRPPWGSALRNRDRCAQEAMYV